MFYITPFQPELYHLCLEGLTPMICKNSTWIRTLLCIMIGSVLYPWVNGDPLNLLGFESLYN